MPCFSQLRATCAVMGAHLVQATARAKRVDKHVDAVRERRSAAGRPRYRMETVPYAGSCRRQTQEQHVSGEHSFGLAALCHLAPN
jgi:hypothetical protein